MPRPFDVERRGLVKTRQPHAKDQDWTLTHCYEQNCSRWTQDLNVRAGTIKPVENTRKASGVGFGNGFLDKTDKQNYIQLKSSWTSKDTINRVKGDQGMRKLSENHISDKRLTSGPRKGFLQLQNKQTKNKKTNNTNDSVF